MPCMSKTPAARILDLVRRVGASRLGVLVIGRVVSPLQRALYQATGGRISLTAVHFDLTDREGLGRLREWDLERMFRESVDGSSKPR